MASVMALGSVSIVAFADDAIKTEAVSKDDLQKYVDSFDSFLKDGIYDYGTKQAEHFQDAIDYAENVLSDGKATADDYTAAYQMVKAVEARFEMHTAEQLKDLLKDNEDIYDSENILNEDLGDHIYDQDTYDAFVIAYDDADRYIDSEDGRLINDAYEELVEAIDGLSKLPTVTKSDFRAAIKDYEAIIKQKSDYESWRRGECSVEAKTGGSSKKLKSQDFVTFGQIIDVVYGDSEDDWAGGSGEFIETNSEASVEVFVKKEYQRFDEIKSSSATTDEVIRAAYDAAVEAVKVFKGWKADDTNRAVKASVVDIIDDYRDKLANDFAADVCQSVVTNGGSANFDYTDGKLTAKKDAVLLIDKTTGFIALDTSGARPEYNESASGDNIESKKIGKKQSIMKYIPVTSDDVEAAITAGAGVSSAKADFDAAKSDYNTAKSTLTTKINDLKALTMPTVVTGTVAANDHSIAVAGALTTLTDITDPTKSDGTKVFDATAAGSDWMTDKYKKFTYTAPTDADEDNWTDKEVSKAAEEAVTAWNDAVQAIIDAHSDLDTKASNYTTKKNAYDAAAGGYSGPEIVDATNDLALALFIVEQYLADSDKDFTAEYQATSSVAGSGTSAPTSLEDLDENGTVAKATGSRTEYTLIYRYLKYALEDLYPAKKESKYTKRDVDKLTDDCYELAEKTGDAALFTDKHMALVEGRRAALEWVTKANAMKGYKDGEAIDSYTSKYALTGAWAAGGAVTKNSTEVYEALKDLYDDLEDMYKAYAVSYGEIADTIAAVADGIDKKAYGAKADEVKKLLDKVAYELSTLNPSEDENEAFTSDREFVEYNRLKTAKWDSANPNGAEKDLYKDYQALLDAIKEPEGVLGDLNGDGYVNALDALAILEADANVTPLTDAQKAFADYNKDGAINALDALAILEAQV